MSASANATDIGSLFDSSADLQSFSAYVHPSLNSLMISHTFLSLLIPLIISLFYFSTPQSRRRPIFALNLAAIFLALVMGVLIDALVIHTLLEPLNPWPPLINIIVGFLGVWESMLVDSILLVRLIFVYPPRHIGPMRFALLITVPVLLKLTRAINLILFFKTMVNAMSGPNALATTQTAFSQTPFIKIEWATQMVDNIYASLAFLWRLRGQGYRWNMTNFSDATFSQRVRTLSGIALANFVVPALFSIVQFVCLDRGVDITILNQLMLANIMISTFGVAFATVWAGNLCRQEAQTSDSNPIHHHSTSHVMDIFRGQTELEHSTATIASSMYVPNLKERVELQA